MPVPGLIQRGPKFGYQSAIPKDVRDAFEGRKKFTAMFETEDRLYAERLAADARWAFKARVYDLRQAALNDERMTTERMHQVVGYLFGQFFGKQQDDRYFDLAESLSFTIYEEGIEDGMPLLQGVPREGLLFDEIVKHVEILLEWSERGMGAQAAKKERPGATMVGAHAEWANRANHTQKTKDQYGKDVRAFTDWFEEKHGACFGAAIIAPHVNDYVSWLMHKNAARSTIMRALSANRLIFKAGRFGRTNPFAGVTDRMVIDGSKMTVRRFTDREVIRILKVETDANAHMAILIAAYSGMRLSEIADLKIKDIERVGQNRVFDLMNAGRRKNKDSYRKVPVHSAIWRELKPFIKGRDPEDYILPNEIANKYGNRSANLSRRVNTAIDVISKDREVREHSFRHAFISKLADAGVRRELRKAIVGHAGDGDAHDEYTQTDFIKLLLGKVELVVYN
jgi:integrase